MTTKSSCERVEKGYRWKDCKEWMASRLRLQVCKVDEDKSEDESKRVISNYVRKGKTIRMVSKIVQVRISINCQLIIGYECQ